MRAATPSIKPTDDVAAVLLAAGAGSRFHADGHKLTAVLPATGSRPSETVAERSLASVIAAEIGPVIVVTGAADLSAVVEQHEAGAVVIAHNSAWADGQMTSVRVGIDTARSLEATRVVIGLADQPGVTPDAWRSVAEAGSDASLAVATYDGRRGNPVALGSDIWDLLPEAGDEGARSLMRRRPDLVVEVPCSGSSDDIDTTEDLRRWQNNSSTNSP